MLVALLVVGILCLAGIAVLLCGAAAIWTRLERVEQAQGEVAGRVFTVREVAEATRAELAEFRSRR